MNEGRFVPSGVDLRDVDARWDSLRAANPKYFDGSLLQVLGTSRNGHGGVQIHAQECSYRFYAVQKATSERAGLDCGVRPLGVKAIAVRGDEVLVGRRSSRVAFYPGAWEFVPGGGLEPGVAPAEMVRRELREEAGVEAASPPIAVALLYDPGALTWEVVHRLELWADARPEHGWEYEELRFVRPEEMPSPRAQVAEQMMGLAEAAVGRSGYSG